jgi:hypothetical protein
MRVDHATRDQVAQETIHGLTIACRKLTIIYVDIRPMRKYSSRLVAQCQP